MIPPKSPTLFHKKTSTPPLVPSTEHWHWALAKTSTSVIPCEALASKGSNRICENFADHIIIIILSYFCVSEILQQKDVPVHVPVPSDAVQLVQ
jgi:hypothetical protein